MLSALLPGPGEITPPQLSMHGQKPLVSAVAERKEPWLGKPPGCLFSASQIGPALTREVEASEAP